MVVPVWFWFFTKKKKNIKKKKKYHALDIFRFFVWNCAYTMGPKMAENGENRVQKNDAISIFEVWKLSRAYTSVNLA